MAIQVRVRHSNVNQRVRRDIERFLLSHHGKAHIMRLRHIVLLVILVIYAVLGVLFAVRTPAWQAPDEPAHYNYIRFVATTGGFPELKLGDYPHAYLEEIKSRKFPPELSIEPIRYEFHQPPLYYALLAPIYRLTGGALLPLRLVSVLLGAGVVLLAYAVARRIFPQRVAPGVRGSCLRRLPAATPGDRLTGRQ